MNQNIKKQPPYWMAAFNVGIFLSSQPVTRQLFSAPLSLTSVFGMGTGGPSTSSTPTIVSLSATSLFYHTQAKKSSILQLKTTAKKSCNFIVQESSSLSNSLPFERRLLTVPSGILSICFISFTENCSM